MEDAARRIYEPPPQRIHLIVLQAPLDAPELIKEIAGLSEVPAVEQTKTIPKEGKMKESKEREGNEMEGSKDEERGKWRRQKGREGRWRGQKMGCRERWRRQKKVISRSHMPYTVKSFYT